MTGGIEDLVHQRPAISILECQDVAGDFHEKAVQLSLVPVGEDLVHLVGAEAQAVLKNIVSLADQLHVAVLDAIVDHLDVVTRTAIADPVTTRNASVHLGGDALKNVLHGRPRLG